MQYLVSKLKCVMCQKKRPPDDIRRPLMYASCLCQECFLRLGEGMCPKESKGASGAPPAGGSSSSDVPSAEE